MTEFGSSWVGWGLGADRSDVVDVMSRPEGGIALVEVSAHPLRLVTGLGNAAAQLTEAVETNNALYMSQYIHEEEPTTPESYPDNYMAESFPQHKADMKVLLDEIQDILLPVRDSLGAPSERRRLHLIFGLRHRHKGHLDPHFVRVWCGSDKPGFFVDMDDNRIWLPSLPENYVLLMRGNKHPTLNGIRHGAVYRSSKTRRAALLAS